jgi:biopolymer transport protein ExbB/TolQ
MGADSLAFSLELSLSFSFYAMNLKLVLNSLKSDRRELDIPSSKILGFSALLTAAIYLLMLPLKATYVGILLYERGFTQVLVIAFASFVIVFLLLKLLKIRRELGELRKDYFPLTVSAFKPTDQGVTALQAQLGKENNLLAQRCSRVLGAYIYSHSRQVATDFAVEDANFYQAKSESSYTLPRILIWAIPLLGFIGTVMGISSAVNGFSKFLNQSSDVAQIKEGIGTVTSGLAVAFDTTLLALLFSVLVMIPLVMVERQESRLLLGIDIYINDKILPRLKEKTADGGVDEESLREIVDESILMALPSHEALVQPAERYAESALERLTDQLSQGLQPLQSQVQELLDQLGALQETMQGDRQHLVTHLEDLQRTIQGDRQNLIAHLEDLQQTMAGDRQAFMNRLPNAEALIQPAQIYSEQASQRLSQSFIDHVKPIQAHIEGLLTQLVRLQAGMQGDRQEFLNRLSVLTQPVAQPDPVVSPPQTIDLDLVAQRFNQQITPIQDQLAAFLSHLDGLKLAMKQDRQDFLERLPTAEALIQPAQIYAHKASESLARSFSQEVQPLQAQVAGLLDQVETLRATLQGDRQLLQQTIQGLIESFEAKIPSADALIKPAQIYAEEAAQGFLHTVSGEMEVMQTHMQKIIRQFDDLQTTLRDDRKSLNTSLQQAAIALQERVEQLAKHSAEINEVSQLQASLDRTLQTLKEKATLETVLEEIQITLQTLKPSLDQISKPRRITLVEKED